MVKITFLGTGSTIFAKNVLGDCILSPELGELYISLYDIDPIRLEDSRRMLENINKKYNGKATIHATLDKVEALSDVITVQPCGELGGCDLLRNMAQGSVPDENVATDPEVETMLDDVFGG